MTKLINRGLFLSACILSSLPGFSIMNPAAKYCEVLGYEYVVEKDSTGAEFGICILPDGSKVDAWDFYKGKVKQEYSYCAKFGYNTELREAEKFGDTLECLYCTKSKGLRSAEALSVEDLMKANGDFIEEEQIEIVEDAPKSSLRSLVNNSIEIVPNLPERYDSRDYDVIGGIKNQGQCGSCYAFAAAACTEIAYNRFSGSHGTNKKELSEAFMVWCLSDGINLHQCNGMTSDGSFNPALQKVNDYGLCESSYFPYTIEQPEYCTHWNDPNVKAKDYGCIINATNDQIKSVIYKYGAAYLLVNGNACGYHSIVNINSNVYNHAVVAVGWNKLSNGKEYWIIRNSWGTSSGFNGYDYLTMNAHTNHFVSYLIPSEVSLSAEYIREQNQIPAEGNVKFLGRKNVKLNAGFKVNRGGNLHIYITNEGDKAPTLITSYIGSAGGNIREEAITDSENIEFTQNISIYPNPTTGDLTIALGENVANVTITDMIGNIISSQTASGDLFVDMSSYNKGIYLVKVVTENDSYIEKVVLK